MHAHIRYMIFTLPDTRRRFLKEIDKYGDSYTKETDVQNLKEAFAMLVKLKKEEEEQQQRQQQQCDGDKTLAPGGAVDSNEQQPLHKRKRTSVKCKEEAEEEVNLKRKRVEELKLLLREMDLRVSGAKEELVQRILDCKYRGLRPAKAKRVKTEDDRSPANDGDSDQVVSSSSSANAAGAPAPSTKTSGGNGGDDDDDDGDGDDEEAVDIAALEKKYFWCEEEETKPWWAIFRDYVAYFDRYTVVRFALSASSLAHARTHARKASHLLT
jgi:hypothetical protein